MEGLGPRGQAGQHLQPADDDLDREQHRCADGEPHDGGVLTLRAPRDHGHAGHDRADDRGHPAVEDVGRRQLGQGRCQ